MSVLTRWTSKLTARLALAAAARRRYMAHPTKAGKALLLKRRAQVAEARRVIARHRRVTRVSGRGVALVKRFEGFVGHPYQDAVGVWTIGYGHTAGVGPHTKSVTEAQASALLKRDLDARYAPPVSALKLALSQSQFDALVSFVYNVGPGGIAATTSVGRALRAHDYRAAADHLLDWNKAGGRVLAGLTARRRAERALFLS